MTLFVKDIVSIGAVDAGDNPEAEIVFWKRRKKQTASSGETKETSMIGSFDLTGLPDETRDGLIAEFEKLQAERDAAIAAVPPAEEPIEKAIDPELADLVAKHQAELAEKDAELQVEIVKRRDAETVLKVREDGLEDLLGPAETVGPQLRTLQDAAPDAFATVYGNLLAAAQRVDLSKAFEEIGASEGEVDAIAKRDAYVAKRRADGDYTSDIYKLRKEFWEAHPELVAESREK